MKKLYLVDVSSMYFRAYYAVRPLTNKSGLPTNALYGFVSMAVKLLKDVSPDYMAFCFDRKEPTFRKELYPEYKANRSEMPEDLVPQVPYIRKITDALGVPAFEQVGFEADDIIGSIAKWGRRNGLEVVIVSGDKDFAQLVEPYVTIYDTMKDVHYDVAGVIEKWGIEPSQVVDYLALTGDSSDNIPGVDGIGPKGAQKLLQEFKSLDALYENIQNVPNVKLREKLLRDKDNAFLSRKLAQIRLDMDLNLSLESLRLRPLPHEELRVLLEELDFKSFEKRLLNSAAPASSDRPAQAPASSLAVAAPSRKSEEPLEGSAAEALPLEPADVAKSLSVQTETWGISTERGIFISQKDKLFRLEGPPEKFGESFDRLQPRWKGFDLKDLWHSLGVIHPTAVWDSAIAAYVTDGKDVADFAEVLQQKTGRGLPDLASGSQWLSCYQLLESALKEELIEKSGQSVYADLDLPLAPILYGMERRGVCLDTKLLADQSKQLETEVRQLEAQIFEMTGQKFSLNSPKQLSEVLFEKLKMPAGRKTKTGLSTDSDVLLKLSKDYPVCLLIIEYRELTKLKSTYLDSLPALVDQVDHRIHTRFNQTVTTTGRLSSTHPNLQNIPIRTPKGQQIRKAFVVDPGHVLISADYSQIELRILAHISGDPGLVAAFENDLDIHAATAAEVFEIPLSAVTPNERRVAKAVNFGIAYGMSPFGLSENLAIPVEEAAEIIKKYFSRFRKVRDYMNDTIESAKSQGFVETLYGRRRYMTELQSKNANIRKFGERAAINAPMQGTAADIVKKAMIEVDKVLPDRMTLQVHDELVFEVPQGEALEICQMVKQKMESVIQLKVPLKVNIAQGLNWDEAH